MTKNQSYKPSSFLSRYIDRYYTKEILIGDHDDVSPILPGTGLEIFFYLNNDLKVNTNNLSKGHTICTRKPAIFDCINNTEILSIRFKSGAFRHFCSVPFSELNDQYLSLEDIWGNESKVLHDYLEEECSIMNKIRIIEHFLFSQFQKYHQLKNDLWDRVIDTLYYNFDALDIKETARLSHLSLRQFERNFKTQFGVTAKDFQKITRFQTTTKKVLLRGHSMYADIALDHGYFDQSHFIKDFKTYTNQLPSQYFKTNNFTNHYYHPSIE